MLNYGVRFIVRIQNRTIIEVCLYCTQTCVCLCVCLCVCVRVYDYQEDSRQHDRRAIWGLQRQLGSKLVKKIDFNFIVLRKTYPCITWVSKKYIIKNKCCQFLGQALTARPFPPAGLWTTRLVPDSPLWLPVVRSASSCFTQAGDPGGGCFLLSLQSILATPITCAYSFPGIRKSHGLGAGWNWSGIPAQQPSGRPWASDQVTRTLGSFSCEAGITIVEYFRTSGWLILTS